MSPRGVLQHWASVLPLTENTPRITLGEGDTPLVRASHLESLCGLDELWFKLEMCNPTGSFKDRGMVVAVAKAMEGGARAIMCASTGNTSASAAAYAAHVGLECFVLVPGGKVAAGKMAQASAFGSRIIEIDGNFDDALSAARELTREAPRGAGQFRQSAPYRGAEDSRLRDLRRARRSTGHPRHSGRQRGQHHGLLERLRRMRRGRARDAPSPHVRLPGGGRCPPRERQTCRRPPDGRHRHPHRQSRHVERRDGRTRRERRTHRGGHGRTRSWRRTACSRARRGSLPSPPARPALPA